MKRINVEVLKRLAEQSKKDNPMVSFLDSDKKIMLLARKIHDLFLAESPVSGTPRKLKRVRRVLKTATLRGIRILVFVN